MIALIKGEPGGELVQQILDDESIAKHAHVLNMAEVFYDVSRRKNVLTARNAVADFQDSGVTIISDMSTPLWEDAAQIKADWKRVSLADCFGVALARKLNGEFVTADRHELEVLENNNVARFVFIR